MRRILALLFALAAVPLLAQSTILNNIPGTGALAGATCPPTLNPGAAGALYTCTGTGALYTWTGSAWVAAGGGGGGTIGGTIAITQIAVGSGADTIAGSANFIFDSDGNVRLFSADTSTQDYLLDVVSQSSSAANPEQFYPRMLHSIFNMDGTGTIVNKRVIPLDGEVFNNSTGRIDWSSSAELYAENISTGTWGTMIGGAARLFNDDSATVDEMVGFQTSPASHFANGNYGGGTVTSYTAFEGNSVNANGTYGAVYGLHLTSQTGLTVTGNNHAINYNDTFVVDSLGQNVDGINASQVPDVDSSLYDAPTLAGAGAGNVSNGTHRYKFIYGNAANSLHTADSGAPTAAVTVTNNAVNGKVTVNVPGLCDAIYPYVFVYRDKDSDGVYKLVDDLNRTCEKTLLDNVADGSLGAVIPTTNNTLAPILSVSDGNIVIPSRADNTGNQDLFFSAISTGGAGPYIAFKPEDRLTAATPIKGFIFWGGYNLVPASIDYAEGAQIGVTGGQDTSGGQSFMYGGAAFSNGSADFQSGAFLTMGGGTATAGGAFSLNSGSSFAAGNINGGDGEIVGGSFANSGHYGDFSITQWRNMSLTAVGAMTLVGGDASAIGTDTTTAHTLILRAYDVDGTTYRTFGTLTNGNTPTFALASPAGGTLTITSPTIVTPTITAPVTINEAVGSSALTLTGATQTASFPVLSATQTWNNAGVTFTAMKLNVTSTASAAASLLMDLQVGNSSQATISKGGNILGAVQTGGSASNVAVGIAAGRGIWTGGGSQLDFAAGSNTLLTITQTAPTILVPADAALGFGPNTQTSSSVGSTVSVAFYRDAANAMALRNSTNAQTFNIYNTYTSTTSYEQFNVLWSSNVAHLGTNKGSGGGTARVMQLDYGGTTTSAISVPITSGTVTFGGSTTANYYIGNGSGLTVANVGANSCGTTAATVAGGASSFEVTVGATSGTQCRVTLPTAAPNRWNCAPSNTSTAALVRAANVDTTNVDLLGVFTAGDVISVVCVPR